MTSSDDQDRDAGHQSPSRDTDAMVGLACLVIALALAALLPFATRAQPADKAWFLSPRIIPMLGIAMIGLPGLVLSLRLLAGWRGAAAPRAYLRRALWAFGDLAPALGYTVLFCIYLFLVALLGFAISTLLFGQACLWFAGLRGPLWLMWNLAFTLVLVLALRVGLGLWFPFAPIFSLLPPDIGNLLSQYL